jgi:rhamnogalacturonyl hydrolase YesR
MWTTPSLVWCRWKSRLRPKTQNTWRWAKRGQIGNGTGVKNGWLDAKTYGPAARRAWIAVAGYIDQNENVTNVCEGTGKHNSYDYYMARKRITGDFHGQAPVLWAASALLR